MPEAAPHAAAQTLHAGDAFPAGGKIRVVFADLDGTLYPGAYEEGPGTPGFLRNMAAVYKLEERAVPVIPATGNNLCLAQAKFGATRDLRYSPGIYCNGAYVKGLGGREVYCRSLGDCLDRRAAGDAGLPREAAPPNIVDALVSAWVSELDAVLGGEDSAHKRLVSDVCLGGLGKETLVLLSHPAHGRGNARAREVGSAFEKRMDCQGEWISGDAMRSRAGEVLSFIMLFPIDVSGSQNNAMLLEAQEWLHGQGLLRFERPAARLSSGTPSSRFDVVCKHVHVPGIGPEIDISPTGVNKGSAIKEYLDHAGGEKVENDHIAVFGDAGNDMELWGRRLAADGQLHELAEFPEFRPAVRVAMPWANDKTLLGDSNVVAPCDVVLERIVAELGPPPPRAWPSLPLICSCLSRG